MKETAWFGGFFDGEGCVQIKPTNGSDCENYRCGANVSQRNEQPLREFKNRWGGVLNKWKNKKYNTYSWGWQINGQESLKFFKDIYPYTIVKKSEIALAIEFLELGEHRKGVPSEILTRRREIYQCHRDIKDEQKRYGKY